MAKVIITGAEEIRRNLELQKDAMKKNVLAGMIQAAILIKRDVTKGELPTTPVDIGNLRASFFISTVLGVKVGKSPKFKREKGKKGKSKLAERKYAELVSSHTSAVASSLAEVTAARNFTLIMGYGANYAIWVHEMMNPSINWSKEGSGPKWFELSLKRNRNNMLKLIGTSARIQTTKHFTATKTDFANTETEEI